MTINCIFTLLKIVYEVVAQLSLKRRFCPLRNTCSVFVEFNKEENNSNISALIHAHKETLTITLNRLYSWPCFRQQVISTECGYKLLLLSSKQVFQNAVTCWYSNSTAETVADSRKNTNTVPTTVFSLALDTDKGLLGLFIIYKLLLLLFITELISCEGGNVYVRC